MALLDDFTNFYVDIGHASANNLNGGSDAGAVTYAPTDCTVDAGTPTVIVDNAGSNQWAGCSAGQWLVWDTAGAKEHRRVVTIAGANLTVQTACTAGANKTVRVAGVWKNFQPNGTTGALGFLRTTSVNADGDPPKLWVKGGTSYTGAGGEAGATGIVDSVADFTMPLSLTIEGYTSTPGDGTDTAVLLDAVGSGLHGLYLNHDFYRFRFIGFSSGTNSKYAFRMGASSQSCEITDCSATASGGTGVIAFVLYQAAACTRVRVISSTGTGISVLASGYYGSISNCWIDSCVTGLAFASGRQYGVVGTVISNCSGNAITIGADYQGQIAGCTFYNIGGDALSITQPTYVRIVVVDCAFEDIDGEAIDLSGNAAISVSHCAFYDCGSGGNTYFDANVLGGTNDLTDPRNHNVFVTYTEVGHSLFVDAGNGDFTPNTTAGWGALLCGAGSPVGTTDNNRDIGAIQHTDPAVGDVLLGVAYGNKTGTLDAIQAEDIVDKKYVLLSHETFTGSGDYGTLVLTTPGYLLLGAEIGVSDDLVIGTYVTTNVVDVIDSTWFGAEAAEQGTYHQPDQGEVIESAHYGPDSGIVGDYHEPAAADVWYTATFGPAGGTSGTMHASNIDNCIPSIIKAGEWIDNVYGTFGGGGGTGVAHLAGDGGGLVG